MVMASTSEQLQRNEPVRASRKEQRDLAKLSSALHAETAEGTAACKLIGPDGEEHELPAALFHILAHVADVLGRGDAIMVAPVGAMLTTQQAADLLNVSRQYLVRLLEEGAISFVKTGTHRRLRLDDVLAYKHKRDRERDAKLRELTRLTEEFDGQG